MPIIVINHVTLDGVMQGPARPDEDTRNAFTQGGWAAGTDDPPIMEAIGKRMAAPDGGMLLGRRSYEDMLSHWNAEGGPFKEALNATEKYVASSSAGTELLWPNSTLLHGDVPAAVGALKASMPGNLIVMGSGRLIRSLLPHGLIDEFLLMIHPHVLGAGQRLFEHDDHPLDLKLVESTGTASDVVLATYRAT